MRFLCLHGIGSNSNVLRAQLSLIQNGLGSQHEFVFIQGEIPSVAGPGVEGLAGGPYYSFFGVPTSSELHAALDVIEQALEVEGPFDGIMGFSQGAAIAASYLLQKSNPDNPIKCAVFFCASMPFDVESIQFQALEDGTFKDMATGEDISDEVRRTLPESLDVERYGGFRGQVLHRRYAPDGSAEITIPTVHVYASNEPYYDQSRQLSQMCPSFDKEEIVHRGGHAIPWEQGVTTQVIESIRRMVHAADLQ